MHAKQPAMPAYTPRSEAAIMMHVARSCIQPRYDTHQRLTCQPPTGGQGTGHAGIWMTEWACIHDAAAAQSSESTLAAYALLKSSCCLYSCFVLTAASLSGFLTARSSIFFLLFLFNLLSPSPRLSSHQRYSHTLAILAIQENNIII